MDMNKSMWSLIYIAVGGAVAMAVIYYLFQQNTRYQLLVDGIEREFQVSDFWYKPQGKEGTDGWLVKELHFAADPKIHSNVVGLVTEICKRMDGEFVQYRAMEIHVELGDSGEIRKYSYYPREVTAVLLAERFKPKPPPPDPRLVRLREEFKKKVEEARGVNYRATPNELPKQIWVGYETGAFDSARDFDADQACMAIRDVFPGAEQIILDVTESDTGDTYRYGYKMPYGPTIKLGVLRPDSPHSRTEGAEKRRKAEAGEKKP